MCAPIQPYANIGSNRSSKNQSFKVAVFPIFIVLKGKQIRLILEHFIDMPRFTTLLKKFHNEWII